MNYFYGILVALLNGLYAFMLLYASWVVDTFCADEGSAALLLYLNPILP